MIHQLSSFFLKYQKSIIVILLVAINVVALFFYDLHIFKVARIFSSVVALVYMFLFISRNTIWIIIAGIFVLCMNISSLYFMTDNGKMIYLIFFYLFYLTIGITVLKYLKWKKIRILYYPIYLTIFLFNGYLFYFVLQIIDVSTFSATNLLIIKIAAVFSLSVALLVGFWDSHSENFSTTYLIYCVLGFIYADFYALLAMFYDESMYHIFGVIERASHLFALYFIVKFTISYLQSSNKIDVVIE